jgi:hypothetical protein
VTGSGSRGGPERPRRGATDSGTNPLAQIEGVGWHDLALAAIGWQVAVDREQAAAAWSTRGLISVTEPHDWPLERPGEGTLRPWYLTATGYLVVLFGDPEEAQRAQRGLLERQVPAGEVRVYDAEELLQNLSRLQKERSLLARAVAALSADPPVKQRFLDNARAGGSAMWLIAPTRERAKKLIGLLADYSYSSLRYYGDEGVADLEQNT